MNKKKTLSDRLRDLSYMQTAAGLFVISVIMTVVCLWRGISTGGQAGPLIALAAFLGLAAAIAGAAVTLYGHFAVRMDTRTHWLWGLIPNVCIVILYIAIYIIGIGD